MLRSAGSCRLGGQWTPEMEVAGSGVGTWLAEDEIRRGGMAEAVGAVKQLWRIYDAAPEREHVRETTDRRKGD